MKEIPAATTIENISLRVHEIESAAAFYREILGLHEVASRKGEVHLAASSSAAPIVILKDAPNAAPRVQSSPGLFHTAFLFPNRRALSAALHRVVRSKWPLQGFADHGVSEAIYLADSEGNGIELYADRPRESWPHLDGQIAMKTEPLDVQALLRLSPDDPASAIAADTIIGHIHLQVSNLKKAEKFYHSLLGFGVTQRSYPGALFLSAGGYHHHIGLNIWNSRDSEPSNDTTGLDSFAIRVPDRETLRSLTESLGKEGLLEAEKSESSTLRDFDRIQIHVIA